MSSNKILMWLEHWVLERIQFKLIIIIIVVIIMFFVITHVL